MISKKYIIALVVIFIFFSLLPKGTSEKAVLCDKKELQIEANNFTHYYTTYDKDTKIQIKIEVINGEIDLLLIKEKDYHEYNQTVKDYENNNYNFTKDMEPFNKYIETGSALNIKDKKIYEFSISEKSNYFFVIDNTNVTDNGAYADENVTVDVLIKDITPKEDGFLIDVEVAFSLVGAVIFVGFIGSYIFQRFGIPEVLSLIFLGVIIGPFFGIVEASDFKNISEIFASIALMIILFDGGLNLKLSKVLQEAASSTLLAIVCFTLSFIAVGFVAGVLIFDHWLVGFLFGAVVAGTSGAIVIPIILKMKDVKESTKIKMSIETTVTDVLCIVIAIAIADYLVPQGGGSTNAAQSIVNAFSVGLIFGLGGGILWLKIMGLTQHLQYAFMMTLAFVFVIFAGTEAVGGSGPVAALIIGLVLSNGEEVGRMFRYKQKTFLTQSMKDFHAEISFFIKSFFFVYTGLLIQIQSVDVVFYGLLVTAVIFGVRHISLLLIMKREELQDRELMTILIPRGLAAAVLATIPITRNFNKEGIISNDLVNTFVGITFIVIITTVFVTTIGIPLGQKRWTKENMKLVIAKRKEKKQKIKKLSFLKKKQKEEIKDKSEKPLKESKPGKSRKKTKKKSKAISIEKKKEKQSEPTEDELTPLKSDKKRKSQKTKEKVKTATKEKIKDKKPKTKSKPSSTKPIWDKKSSDEEEISDITKKEDSEEISKKIVEKAKDQVVQLFEEDTEKESKGEDFWDNWEDSSDISDEFNELEESWKEFEEKVSKKKKDEIEIKNKEKNKKEAKNGDNNKTIPKNKNSKKSNKGKKNKSSKHNKSKK